MCCINLILAASNLLAIVNAVVLSLLFAIVMLMYNQEYFSFIVLLIFFGSILVIILFYYMMTDIEENNVKNTIYWWIYLVLIIYLWFKLGFELNEVQNIIRYAQFDTISINFYNIDFLVFIALYNNYFDGLILISLMLLVVMLGVIAIILYTMESILKIYQKTV
jgi:NADH:ubiquinone oxidoreductase subunit 6 (subunit J)